MTRRGATLVEVMVAIGISTMIMTVAYNLFSFGTRTAKRAGGSADVSEVVSLALIRLRDEVGTSADIKVPASGATSKTLEFLRGEDATFVLGVEEDRLVLKEKFGSKVQRLGVFPGEVEFSREGLPERLLEVRFRHGSSEDAVELRTVIYLRGLLR